MFYTKSAKYAIQTMIYLAIKENQGLVMVSEIANAYHISQSFLSKITRTLRKYNLIKSTRGRNGGIKLAKSKDLIFISDILLAIDGPESIEPKCIFGYESCSEMQPCPFHHRWEDVIVQIHDLMETETLGSLTADVMERNYLPGIKEFSPNLLN
ncbi:MAG: Rrf2 family transcriptional regulator [Candidatus Marinimicrobia bacterium]|jgi:Rrf2 family protein|nr:Rrf2 family transcriptional regulator [Candidatus Neomarinimicrobiota bacterium]MBT3947295.1 Rrf2 family transcriptional regulator [Candidatus Neomarinimicrobiota bacterium]MBT4063763.1 Rrf2 family transcriptional regulator [Candidatus Neomarinimicrobiota bacterium]MBT4307759.1 Rrf2 family transcriptional regulator [Candidatus Neomarinimicrobiota bacterium]MBT4453352.1 Rrf2 family transcriptional regulator [Candidatus Neomarinimicrobiota bacterium]|tara:strand:+ start:734 stop:1195 length:462 start_codon:yes stop_codon:yes gene_type:complete